MSVYYSLAVMHRKGRRTHLLIPGAHGVMCGTRTPLDGMEGVTLELMGGATARLAHDLRRELDGNACIPCTRIALGMIVLYAARDTGRSW